jgi:transposase
MVALRLLADRRDELGVARSQTISRLHRLLLELLPGGAKKVLSAAQAMEMLAAIRPRDIAGQTRRRLAAELITELTRTGKRIKTAEAELKELVPAIGSSLPDLRGIGPSGAARLLGDVGALIVPRLPGIAVAGLARPSRAVTSLTWWAAGTGVTWPGRGRAFARLLMAV